MAVPTNMEYYHIDEFVLQFMKENPQYGANLIELVEAETLKLAKEKRLNLFTNYFFDGEEVDCAFCPVGYGTIVAVLPKNHPLAGKESITPEELRDEKLLLPSRNTKMSQKILDWLDRDKNGFMPNVISWGTSRTCVDFPAQGLGVSVQPLELLEHYKDKTVRYSELDPPLRFRYGMAHLLDAELTEPEKVSVAFTEKHKI